jgi:beta-lactamase regulating signal transducer with metallopeptidase domain
MISFFLDHLLESTLFAMLMGLLTLCYANNRAAVRYGLWFAASIKFLIPFSLIAAAGENLRWKAAPAVKLDLSWAVPAAAPELSLPTILTDVAPPLATMANVPEVAAEFATEITTAGMDVDSLLLALWLGGMAFLLCRWTLQWARLARVRSASTPSDIVAEIPVHFTRMLFEPGLVGVFRPVLLLPEGITAQLSQAQIALVIEHELCHWRRRDNLTAAVHMAVQLVFWFHPLLWWIGARLVTERERACDESVLAAGSSPKDYASSILEVCRFYVRSPLTCASGVAGANLKHRVTRIMENGTFTRLSDAKRALLGTVAVGAIALPMSSGLWTVELAAAEPLAKIPRPAAARIVELPPRKLTPPRKTAVHAAQPVLSSAALELAAFEVGDIPSFEEIALGTPEAAPAPEERIAAESLIAQADIPARSPAPPKVTPPTAPLEEVVVTAKRIRDFVRTRNFVRTYTAPSSFLDQISRWQTPLCVQTVGLAKGYNAYVTARLKEIAAQIGAPAAKNEPCDVNLDVVFTEHPQELLDYIRKERPELLGPHYPALRKKLATVSHPIQAWYATGTRDMRGRWSIDSYNGFGETIDGGPPVYNAFGSHLRSGLTSEFVSVVVVADIRKVQDWEIGTIADYVAMLAFARAKTLDKCQRVPSVANALSDCGDGLRAKALSEFDVAYLMALYTSTPDAPRGLQESGISRAMMKILEKQTAGRNDAGAKGR